MKKGIILLLALALIVAIAIVLVCCSNGNNEPDNGAITTETPEPTPMETPEPTPMPEPTPVETPEPTPIETPEPTIDNETPNIDHELVGTWQYFWEGEPLGKYVLNADATGIFRAFSRYGNWEYIDITWEAQNDILTIFMPSGEIWELEYVVRGDTLSLTGVDGHETLTRAE